MPRKTDSFLASVADTYARETSKLSKVGNTYRQQSANKEKAEEDLIKVYHGYIVFSWILAVILLIGPFWMALQFHQNGWLFLIPFSYALPLGIRWTIRNTLSISGNEYAEWRAAKKRQKQS